jgi:hypothetical protein
MTNKRLVKPKRIINNVVVIVKGMFINFLFWCGIEGKQCLYNDIGQALHIQITIGASQPMKSSIRKLCEKLFFF